MRPIRTLLLAIILSLSLALFPTHAASRYTPHQGDFLTYSETIDLGNSVGPNYSGYTEHQDISGMERMNTVYVNGTVASNYTYIWTFSNSSGSRTAGKSVGNFTWSSNSLNYVRGNDSQTQPWYLKPLSIWFYMDNTTQTNGSFKLLNTPMTVKSTNYQYHLTSQNKYVYAIQAQGTGQFQRNDVYGQFAATYTWNTYFDAMTGYIIGYDYSEQDTNGFGDGFTWTESLSVTTTSYALTTAPGPSWLSQNFTLIIGLVLLVGFILIIAVIAYAVSKRRKTLPRHQIPSVRPPPTIDLTPKQQPPVQQIVIKEVVKVKCKYCGALIDSTVQACPFCGAPRT